MTDIHTIYKTTVDCIESACDRHDSASLTDMWDAQTAGMDALGRVYDATDNENTRSQIRRLIGEIDLLDITGDMVEAPRMFGTVNGINGFYDAADIAHSDYMED